jgi:Family of unknown function (DUF5689)
VTQSTVNRTLNDCNKLDILVRNSGFANFAAAKTPSGKGSVVGVYSVFRQDQQFFIRDTNDVKLTGTRCGSNSSATLMTIKDLRAAFVGGATTAPADKKIKGVVISDKSTNHTDVRNIVIQEGLTGIIVRFSGTHGFNLGDVVEIDISSQPLSLFQGALQISPVPINNAITVGAGSITPKVVTAAEVKAKPQDYESTLVKIVGASFTTTGSYDGTKQLKDVTGEVPVFTRALATFSASLMPTGTTDEVIAIAGVFNATAQLSLRNSTDVKGGTPGTGGGGGGGVVVGDPVATVTEAFDGITANQGFSSPGWTNVAVKGTRTWQGKTFMTDKYVQATSFNSTDAEDEMWLVTPPLILSTQKSLNFRSAISFYKHDGLQVLISTDYNGSNLTTATWKPLTATLAGAASGDNIWVPSGAVTLPIANKAFIAFRYTGNKAANTTSFRLDDITVQ